MKDSTTKKTERQITQREMTLFTRLIQGIELSILAEAVARYEQLSVAQVAEDFKKNRGKLSSRASEYKRKFKKGKHE